MSQCELSQSIAIDNGVSGLPEVQCATDHFSLRFATDNAFNGKVFVKGYAYQSDCQRGGGGGRQDGFSLRFNQCGVARRRQPDGTLAISTTVIVSFHPVLVSKVDRAYRVNCFYKQSRTPVTQHIDVAMLSTENLSGDMPMPRCKYEILARSPDGSSVRYTRVGDKIYHKWSCVTEGAAAGQFCMRVHSCTVNDGQGGPAVLVLDAQGCSLDDLVLQNLDYTGPLMAGQQMHVYKFADRPTLYYNCQIDIRVADELTGCADVMPKCGKADSPYSLASSDGAPVVVSSQYDTGGGRAEEQLPYDMKPAQPYQLKHLRRWRRKRSPSHLESTFDLPEKVITVLDIIDEEQDDAAAAPTASSGTGALFAYDSARALPPQQPVLDAHAAALAPSRTASVTRDWPTATGASANSTVVCMERSRFAGYALALAGVACTTVCVVAAAFVRRRHIFVTDLTGKKQFDRL